jgi:hypothetical protein
MSSNSSSTDDIIISKHENCEVRQQQANKHNGLFASAAFKTGDLIVAFLPSKIVDTPNYLTVQLSEDKHIHLLPEYLQYVNHSCEPNVLFNTTTMQLECVRDIAIGDELRFFYPATEWRIAQEFICHCGKPNCIGLVRGAADTPIAILNQYKLTDFIKFMLDRTQAI